MSSSMEWIRRNYGVPARHKMRVTYGGKPATIVSARGGYVGIRVDGDRRIHWDHPTYRIVYPKIPEPARPRGWCEHCAQDRAMTRDGVMGKHHWRGRSYTGSRGYEWSEPCPGTGKPPTHRVQYRTLADEEAG